MSTQQDIYAAGFENRPPMLNKENYVPWSSRLLRYAKSRPNGKLIYNSIMNDDELTEKELKQIEADVQAIQTILLGLPEDIYAAVDSCETAQEIWFTSTDGESIESYYHHFSKLMNDFKRNKHFPEKIASNLKIKKEVDDLRAERLAKTHDPLALLANSNNPYNFPVFHQDQPSPITYMQQPQPNNNVIPQPSFNQNYMQQPMPDPEDIIDPTTAMNMTLVLMAKAFKLNYSTPTNNNQRISSNPRNRQIAQPVQNLGVKNVGNQNGVIVILGIANQNQNGNGNVVATWAKGNANGNNGNKIRCCNCRGLGHLARNCTVRPQKRDATYLQTQDLDEIEEVNANCILITNLQQASTSGTQTDKAPVYDLDGLAEAHEYDHCYNNEIFNMFTQEEQYTDLLKPNPESHQVQQNDSNVIFAVSTTKVETVNSVNRNQKETNVELITELARYKNQEKCFEISQEKYDKLERCYQKYVYQEQCLTKKINVLHLSSAKMITTLNEEIANLNNMLSKEKSIVSSLQEEKKKLKSDFKIREDELLDKQIQLENKIKELDNFLKATKFVRDFKYLANEADESLAKHKALEFDIERLLRAVVSQDIMSIVQSNSIVDTSNLQTELDLFDKASEQKDTTKGTSENTKFANQSILGRPFLEPLRNNFVVRQPNAFQSERPKYSNNRVPQKVDESNDFSKPVTSNSAPSSRE
ncbi:retrovirus-related pol polyprotein from transposon TNT 1-94 [Tanacetum coccineum]|uniref:Retrovirus-related pol polyprotein from transposon TNT 1-94 n=1 Tax=Tanacetum coccineum TaxID=301880 RepID=A0ABQ5IQI9_9ASTR